MGSFRVVGSPDQEMPLAAIAFEAFTAHNLPDGLEPNLEAQVTYDPPNFSWPFGTHMCLVEVDVETGSIDVLRYVAVDDCGVQVNPNIVDGQVHGGVVQGMAQALFEGVDYDSDGNLQTSTLADYMVPAACDVPPIALGHSVTPSPTNSLGVKGVGEAGTIGAAPTIMNADRRRVVRPRRPRRPDAGQPAQRLGRAIQPPGHVQPNRPPMEATRDSRSFRLRPRRIGRGGDQPHRCSTATSPSSSPAATACCR